MTDFPGHEAGGGGSRLFAFNGGFFTQRRVRRILELAGHRVGLGLPGPDDTVAVWGQSPTAWRGEAVARRRGAGLLRVEDAFLRSLRPGRMGEPPLGLLLDRRGVHFDGRTVSDLEHLLATHPLDDSADLSRARDLIARMKDAHLTKYSAIRPDLQPPEPGYVLVVDQTRGDASVTASGGNDALFREMLVFAQEEHPGARVIIKTHPETASGLRPGYFGPDHVSARVSLFSDPVSPWALLDGAVGVYTLSSQMGFEAILAGHKPRIFGQPFYAGWGLTQDQNAPARRQRRLTPAQLFLGAMMLYPLWYDPFRDRLCDLATAIDNLEAQTRAWREDQEGWVAEGMRLWKRRPLKQFFSGNVRFRGEAPRRMVWASKPGSAGAVRVEDGFLRSRGLGAELVPALSLVTDRRGIYYDPGGPSDLEHWIAHRERLSGLETRRAEALMAQITGRGLSKYNVGKGCPDLPEGHRILVPGQVEDDASILKGAREVRTNAALLAAVRAARPDAVIIYKPHPDVAAGLRAGGLGDDGLADLVVEGADPAALLNAVGEVWTITSLMGFEALIRGVRVTTLGVPFYAGWGLTDDLAVIPDRRTARPDLAGLVHAALIDYPRYRDPVTGVACPVEVVADRLSEGVIPRPGPGNRLLSKLQGIAASLGPFWR